MAQLIYDSTVRLLGRLRGSVFFYQHKAPYLRAKYSGPMVETDFLFAKPSCWSGAARMLDLFGQFDGYNGTKTPNEADALAVFSDWVIVGQDLMEAASSIAPSEKPAPKVAESALVATR